MKKVTGFTLIELMITLAVAAILLTIGVPSFQYIIQGNRVSTQTNDLITGLSTARSEAIRRNREVTLEPIGGDWMDGFQITSDGTVLRTFDAFGDGIVLDDDDGNDPPDDVTFLGDGTRGRGSGTIAFGLQPDADCLGDMRRVITVTVGGGTRTERLECNS